MPHYKLLNLGTSHFPRLRWCFYSKNCLPAMAQGRWWVMHTMKKSHGQYSGCGRLDLFITSFRRRRRVGLSFTWASENEIGDLQWLNVTAWFSACAALYPIPTTGHELSLPKLPVSRFILLIVNPTVAAKFWIISEDKAKAMGIQQLFILTTRTPHTGF